MGFVANTLFLVLTVGLFLSPPNVEGAKKKKETPVNVMKASETKYSDAKLYQTKKVKKKKFLWFKKKEKSPNLEYGKFPTKVRPVQLVETDKIEKPVIPVTKTKPESEAAETIPAGAAIPVKADPIKPEVKPTVTSASEVPREEE